MSEANETKIHCPHCKYELTEDDMYFHSLFDIAKNEEETDVNCTLCRQKFYVKGSYLARYESFKTIEEIQ